MIRKWRQFREDKGELTKPRCPFCNEPFDPPYEISTELGFFIGGVCNCNAVYVYDVSGKNLGEAYMDALSYACKENWELALSLEPEKDYNEVYIRYNYNNHSVLKNSGYGVRGIKGEIVFIKLKRNILSLL